VIARTNQRFGCFLPETRRRTILDKEHIKGAARKAEGAVKTAAGKATGDRALEIKGRADTAGGKTREAAGDVKDALKPRH
jgi:uncharacterized protein YjbJ (UPF0337 family)